MTGIVMVLVWALVIAGVIWVARLIAVRPGLATSTQPAMQPPTAAARRLLDERFARGEIDAAEYQERRQSLDAP